MHDLSDLLTSPNAGTFAAWSLIGDERTVIAALVSGAISIMSVVLLER